jgi:hypothetical protein
MSWILTAAVTVATATVVVFLTAALSAAAPFASLRSGNSGSFTRMRVDDGDKGSMQLIRHTELVSMVLRLSLPRLMVTVIKTTYSRMNEALA